MVMILMMRIVMLLVITMMIDGDEDGDDGICYILFGDKGSNLGF